MTANKIETYYEARPTKYGIVRWGDISHSERTIEEIKTWVEANPSNYEEWGWTIIEVTITHKIITI